MKLFAVTGKPVWHSLSPQLHNAALEGLAIQGRYFRLAADSAQQALCLCRQVGISGLNITAPFKQDMTGLVDELDETARQTGAVNTVVFDGKRTRGYNTDVYGVVSALRWAGIRPAGKRVLILGAGGSARAAAAGFLGCKADVSIANRTGAKAQQLAREFGCASIPWTAGAMKHQLKDTDIVIGCLSHSENIIQSNWLGPDTVVLDAVYARPSHLAEQALLAGCRVIDGKYWLLHQAVKAFQLFTGVKPATGILERGYGKGSGPVAAFPVIGFMGSGKSTVTRILAKRLGYKRMDLDRAVERREGKSIAAIFAGRGEPYFRKMESAALAEAGLNHHVVLDCGGGIMKSIANRRLLKSCGPVIWLWADKEETQRRLAGDNTRPVLGKSLASDKFSRLMESRIPLYAQTADILFPSSHKTPKQVANDIISEIDCAGLRRR